jgi:hypothetical protein
LSQLAIMRDVEKACALLARAKTLDEVLHVHDAARALETYARLRERGSEAHADAWELRALAERRAGELSRTLPKATAGRKKSVRARTDSQVPETASSKGAALREHGLTKQLAHRAEKLAEVPLADFNARLAAGRERVLAGKPAPNLAAVSSGTGYDGDSYGTPGRYLEAAREVLGGIELDPASNTDAANVVRAERWFHKGDDGLEQSWECRSLWLNPPYSAGLIDRFVAKLTAELDRIDQAIVLVNCAPSTKWFQQLLECSDGFVLFDHRIAFLLDGKPIKGNRYEQAAFYFGDGADAFLDAFAVFGTPCRTAYQSAPAAMADAVAPPRDAPLERAAGADDLSPEEHT